MAINMNRWDMTKLGIEDATKEAIVASAKPDYAI